MTAQRGKSPDKPFAAIYRDLAEHPSEHVTEALEGLRLSKRSITTAAVREVVDRRVQIAAKVAEMPTDADVAHLARVSVLCQPKPDRLDEKIARCITRRGISKREQVLYQRERERYPIDGWGYLPSANWFESECHCRDHESAANHDFAALREDILSELTAE